MIRKGRRVNPILGLPGMSHNVIRLDWLHAVDMGVSADSVGSLFWLLERKFDGATRKERVSQLQRRLATWYRDNGVQDRVNSLTPTTIKPSIGKWPKLKCSAAALRKIIPFAKALADDLCAGGNAEEATAKAAMAQLHMCYETLRSDAPFPAATRRDAGFKFAQLYAGLARLNGDGWRIKPKMHQFLEAVLEGGDPTASWTYRDEDWGGTAAALGRSRGSSQTPSGVSQAILAHFRMHAPIRMLSES